MSNLFGIDATPGQHRLSGATYGHTPEPVYEPHERENPWMEPGDWVAHGDTYLAHRRAHDEWARPNTDTAGALTVEQLDRAFKQMFKVVEPPPNPFLNIIPVGWLAK